MEVIRDSISCSILEISQLYKIKDDGQGQLATRMKLCLPTCEDARRQMIDDAKRSDAPAALHSAKLLPAGTRLRVKV